MHLDFYLGHLHVLYALWFILMNSDSLSSSAYTRPTLELTISLFHLTLLYFYHYTFFISR